MSKIKYTYNVPLIVTVDTESGEVESVEINHAPSGTTMNLRSAEEVWTTEASHAKTRQGYEIMESTVWPEPTWAGG